MHYLTLTELETVGYTSCKVQGLELQEKTNLITYLTQQDIKYYENELFYEVEAAGVQMLNLLANNDLNYRVFSQSMAIEESNVGGRHVQVQKLVWTMYKE